MHRRLLLGAATAAPALATPALAQSQTPEIRWRLTSSFPKNLDILYGGSEALARRVAQMTDNRFQIRCFAAGEVVPALQVLDALQAGTVECGQTASLYYVGKDPTFAAFTAIPFGMNMRQMSAWLRHGGGNEIAAELYRDYNVVGIPFGDTGVQMGGWFRKEIRSLDDLSGLKFRISGFAGHLFARLGAAPTQIAGPDIYPSLERGTIDAAEWIGPYDDEKLGFARIARYYYAPGFWEGSSRGVLMINQRAWDSLPEAYRAVLEVACGEATMEMMARYDEGNPKALRRLVAAGAQLRAWPREILQAAWRNSLELYEETSAQNPRFRRMWTSYRAFRDEQFQWFRVAENAYETFAFAAAARS
ncbi:TRAP transporter substrate-binding protein [Roseicella sp. DB1501]|uniref:TRAP transporter substrate-binding protein n=1 Tax=Roseicella sp. DB1501 TaxID=2730925 RepID=UPI0014929EA2|nr:TRAP transporter substrate-binding protein DctP [Roseicella sp. DB1501]NOG69005.1 TRAP transporter substrate-binding protein DctP [Roseicella sp. DB1501]